MKSTPFIFRSCFSPDPSADASLGANWEISPHIAGAFCLNHSRADDHSDSQRCGAPTPCPAKSRALPGFLSLLFPCDHGDDDAMKFRKALHTPERHAFKTHLKSHPMRHASTKDKKAKRSSHARRQGDGAYLRESRRLTPQPYASCGVPQPRPPAPPNLTCPPSSSCLTLVSVTCLQTPTSASRPTATQSLPAAHVRRGIVDSSLELSPNCAGQL